MQLIIIRHGETLWNKEGRVQGISDVELSSVGIEQARLLALSLKDHPIRVIHTSPLKRALKTAEVINEFHRKEIHIHNELMEIDPGDFEGVYYKKLVTCEKDFLNKWIADPASVQNFTIAAIICRIRSISLNEFQSSCVGNASKTIVNFQKDGMFIETFDDRSHLQQDIKSLG